ncbi:CRADD-like protein [Mya arenaria]|uniref:CRADD-like protein n=2 Tax=Mya arenaria TaxID=6604 RepID=A0ABY7FXJ5_MYAAR|nr:CRADD-like protein [Mya arenaria]
MREELQRKIKKNIIDIKKDMDAKDLVDHFVQEDVFDLPDDEEINGFNPNTAENRNKCFLAKLLKKDDRAYDVFLQTLHLVGLAHLAEQIENTEVATAPVVDPTSWLAQIAEHIRKRRLTERDLSRLAQSIGTDWELVASEMNLTRVEIDHCRMENSTTTMQVYSALYKWRNKVPGGATLEKFVDILMHCQSTTIDWDIVKKTAQQMG